MIDTLRSRAVECDGMYIVNFESDEIGLYRTLVPHGDSVTLNAGQYVAGTCMEDLRIYNTVASLPVGTSGQTLDVNANKWLEYQQELIGKHWTGSQEVTLPIRLTRDAEGNMVATEKSLAGGVTRSEPARCNCLQPFEHAKWCNAHDG
jgi:hypothetical protein